MTFAAFIFFCSFCYFLALPKARKIAASEPECWKRIERLNETRSIR